MPLLKFRQRIPIRILRPLFEISFDKDISIFRLRQDTLIRLRKPFSVFFRILDVKIFENIPFRKVYVVSGTTWTLPVGPLSMRYLIFCAKNNIGFLFNVLSKPSSCQTTILDI